MTDHTIVSEQEWLEARKALLKKEKAHSKARDELTAARKALPWVKVEKDYRFTGPDGEVTLADLFGEKSQLLLQHFMFEPDWESGCPGCSFMADSIDPVLAHIEQRDVAFAAVSIASVDKLTAYKKRMGWDFVWVSSEGTDFNKDYNVTITQEQIDTGEASYNFTDGSPDGTGESPGVSVFVKGDDGTIYHSYSCYARGLENTISAYNYLDLVPKGRDEDGMAYGMEWLKRHDEY